MLLLTDEQLAATIDAVQAALDDTLTCALLDARDELQREARERCRFTPDNVTGNSIHVSRLARVAR